jgi:hypothetical protein
MRNAEFGMRNNAPGPGFHFRIPHSAFRIGGHSLSGIHSPTSYREWGAVCGLARAW